MRLKYRIKPFYTVNKKINFFPHGVIIGSCWAFSATGAIEGINAIVTGKLTTLSEQELVDCETVSQGCNSGWVDKAFNWVARNRGIASEKDYAYTANQGVCRASKVDTI